MLKILGFNRFIVFVLCFFSHFVKKKNHFLSTEMQTSFYHVQNYPPIVFWHNFFFLLFFCDFEKNVRVNKAKRGGVWKEREL